MLEPTLTCRVRGDFGFGIATVVVVVGGVVVVVVADVVVVVVSGTDAATGVPLTVVHAAVSSASTPTPTWMTRLGMPSTLTGAAGAGARSRASGTYRPEPSRLEDPPNPGRLNPG